MIFRHPKARARKISQALRGRRFSLEHRLNISRAKKGKMPPSFSILQSQVVKEKTRLAVIRSNKKRRGLSLPPLSEARKKKLARLCSGWTHTQEARLKMSIKQKLRTKKNNSGRRSQAEFMSKLWRSSLSPMKDPLVIARRLKAMSSRPNKAEVRLEQILSSRFPGQWRYVGRGDLILGGKCPDFMNVNGSKALIELYGDFWHRNDIPKDRIQFFKKFGYHTLVVWERELKEPIKIVRRVERLVARQKSRLVGCAG